MDPDEPVPRLNDERGQAVAGASSKASNIKSGEVRNTEPWSKDDWKRLSEKELQKWIDGVPDMRPFIPTATYERTSRSDSAFGAPDNSWYGPGPDYCYAFNDEECYDSDDKPLEPPEGYGDRKTFVEWEIEVMSDYLSEPPSDLIFEVTRANMALKGMLPGFKDRYGRTGTAWVEDWGQDWSRALSRIIWHVADQALDPSDTSDIQTVRALLAPAIDAYLYLATHHELDICARVLRDATVLNLYNLEHGLAHGYWKLRNLLQMLRDGGRTRHRLAASGSGPPQHRYLSSSDVAFSYHDIASTHLAWMDVVANRVGVMTKFPTSDNRDKLPRKALNSQDRQRLAASDRRYEDEQARIVLGTHILAMKLALRMAVQFSTHPAARPHAVTAIAGGRPGESQSARRRRVSRASLSSRRDIAISHEESTGTADAPMSAATDFDKPRDVAGQVESAAKHWEAALHRTLLQCLQKAERCFTDAAEALTAHIKAIDWDGLKTYSVMAPSGMHSARTGNKSAPIHTLCEGMTEDLQIMSEMDEDIHRLGKDVKGLGVAASGRENAPPKQIIKDHASDCSEDSDCPDTEPRLRAHSPAGSESDLSHPCPLRDIISLLGEYEQYRRGVYDAIVDADVDGEVRYVEEDFMRGADGAIGEAIDRFGLKLLDKFTADELTAYGLPKLKFDEWKDLSDRRKGLQKGKRLRESNGGDSSWARPALGGFGKK